MAQYQTGTVSVTNGSANIVGTGTLWLTEIAVGQEFRLQSGNGGSYTVNAVTDDTHIVLSTTFQGTTASGLSYYIHRDFTSNNMPRMSVGDVDSPLIFTRAIDRIDELLTITTPSGTTDLDSITDVIITGPVADNEGLFYDLTSNKWINQTNVEAGLALQADLTTHTGNVSNPHSVTKTQIGLSNVDNTTDANKPISTATQTALDLKVDLAGDTMTGELITPKVSYNSAGGWDDLRGPFVSSKTVNSTDPAWSVFRNGIYAHKFSSTAINELWIAFHIPHSYRAGTKIYPHIHWSTSGTNTGTVRWVFEYTLAADDDASAFPTSSSIVLEQAASGTAYRHMVVEVTEPYAIPSTYLYPDTMILCRIYREGNHANDTCTDDAFGFECDLHYQLGQNATLLKEYPYN